MTTRMEKRRRKKKTTKFQNEKQIENKKEIVCHALSASTSIHDLRLFEVTFCSDDDDDDDDNELARRLSDRHNRIQFILFANARPLSTNSKGNSIEWIRLRKFINLCRSSFVFFSEFALYSVRWFCVICAPQKPKLSIVVPLSNLIFVQGVASVACSGRMCAIISCSIAQ